MKAFEFFSRSSEDTVALGAKFAKFTKPGDIICLFGDLGTGKTTFVKGLAKGLKINPAKVHSPTFVLLSIYNGKCPIFHFDLYRIHVSDMFDIGYEEFFYGRGITVIEWSEHLEDLMPNDHWHIELTHQGDDMRLLRFSVRGDGLKYRFRKFLKGLS